MRLNFKDIFFNKLKFHPTADQQAAVGLLEYFVFSKENKIFVLKGYAGTGKTTLMGALINTLPAFGMKSILLAPTGRAAKILSFFSSKRAYTIHKYIYFSHIDDSKFSFRLKDNRHNNAIFIVDESSMIGLGSDGFGHRNLLEDLMQYVMSGNGCKIIFIGDTAQLPPVGEDVSPALDTDYFQRHFDINPLTYQLSEVVRQALDSNILKNASNLRYRLVRQNYSLPIFKFYDSADFVRIESSEFEQTLRSAYKVFGIRETTLVCRTNKSANLLNKYIRYSILERENQIDEGDNLMVVKNNYFWINDSSEEGFIANGDILHIKHILGYEDKFGMRFADVVVNFVDYMDERDVELKIMLDTLNIDTASMDSGSETGLYQNIFDYYYKEIGNKVQAKKNTLNDAYFNALQVKFSNALTCHKAQGGGWKAVFVVQNYFTDDMLNREYFRWLYTAITRAKEKIFLVGFDDNFFKQ